MNKRLVGHTHLNENCLIPLAKNYFEYGKCRRPSPGTSDTNYNWCSPIVVHVSDVKTAASAATKFRLNILGKFSQAYDNVGFKIDVFFK